MELNELVVVVSPTAYILGISLIVCLDISPKGLAQPFPAVADMFKGEREREKKRELNFFFSQRCLEELNCSKFGREATHLLY